MTNMFQINQNGHCVRVSSDEGGSWEGGLPTCSELGVRGRRGENMRNKGKKKVERGRWDEK